MKLPITDSAVTEVTWSNSGWQHVVSEQQPGGRQLFPVQVTLSRSTNTLTHFIKIFQIFFYRNFHLLLPVWLSISGSFSCNVLYNHGQKNFTFLCEDKYVWNWSRWINYISKLIRKTNFSNLKSFLRLHYQRRFYWQLK